MAKAPRKQIYDLAAENQLNSDGSFRQKILQRCLPGQPLLLQRESSNAHDSNAILVVHSEFGGGVGYIPREHAAELASAIDNGVILKARIHELTGGLPEYKNFGCLVCIVAEEKAFRDFLPLRPEQKFYEHAPVWRKPVANLVPRSTSRNARKGNFASTFLKALFK